MHRNQFQDNYANLRRGAGQAFGCLRQDSTYASGSWVKCPAPLKIRNRRAHVLLVPVVRQGQSPTAGDSTEMKLEKALQKLADLHRTEAD